jgi:hypothetical protein
MTANVLVNESWPRPVQIQRHVTKIAHVDLVARKLNLLNLQLYMYVYIYIYIYTYTHTYIHVHLLPCFLWSMGFVVHVNQVSLPLLLHIPLL